MGVEWPDRREDVLNALDILAARPVVASAPQAWPGLTEAVHWLVDDTFWDMRDPAEDIGELLVDEHEAAAVREVVARVVAVSERRGPTVPDQEWFDDPEWPMVKKMARRAAAALRGFAGDAVGKRLRAVERLVWTETDGSSDPSVGPAHLHFAGGCGLFLSGARDWCLDVELTCAGDESWLVPFDYADPAGRWVLRDAGREEPFASVLGKRLDSCDVIRSKHGELIGLILLFEGSPIELRVHEGELRT